MGGTASIINGYVTPRTTGKAVVPEDLYKLVAQMALGDVMYFASVADRTTKLAKLLAAGLGAPPKGSICHLADSDQHFRWTGSAWTLFTGAPGYTPFIPTISAAGGGFDIGTSPVRSETRRFPLDDEIRWNCYVSFTGASFGSGAFQFTLPVTAHADDVDRASGAGWVLDAGTIRRPISVHLFSATVLRLVSDGGDVTASVPFAWVNGDALAFSVIYRPA